jgi:hypothetical protein
MGAGAGSGSPTASRIAEISCCWVSVVGDFIEDFEVGKNTPTLRGIRRHRRRRPGPARRPSWPRKPAPWPSTAHCCCWASQGRFAGPLALDIAELPPSAPPLARADHYINECGVSGIKELTRSDFKRAMTLLPPAPLVDPFARAITPWKMIRK